MEKKFVFGTYVPQSYRELATEEEKTFSQWIINFKNGQKDQLKEAAQMVIKKLNQWYGKKAAELVLVPVPCSSMKQYKFRFAYFCAVVSKTLGQENGLHHVEILGKRTAAHRTPSHEVVSEDNYQVNIDDDFFKGKKVVIVDDVISSGRTADNFAQQMEEVGAIVKGGIFFARTKNTFNQDTQDAAPQEPVQPVAPTLPLLFAEHSLKDIQRLDESKKQNKPSTKRRSTKAKKEVAS